jgi:hypothetical protein
MRLIFLDIDGVLNTHEPLCPEVMCGRLHQDKVIRLNHILRTTGASIVLSSAWRYLVHRGEMNIAGMDWLLRSHGVMSGRLLGITRTDSMREDLNFKGCEPWPVHHERGQQISDWLNTEDPWITEAASYVVIDDLDLGISLCGHPFVQTNGSLGLTEKDAERAIKKLMEQT